MDVNWYKSRRPYTNSGLIIQDIERESFMKMR